MEWNQEDAIAFEAARECLTHWMAILSYRIHQAPVSNSGIFGLMDERSRVAKKRASLHVTDRDEIAEVRKHYGESIRTWLQKKD